jgi:poly(A) polymerase Pap1
MIEVSRKILKTEAFESFGMDMHLKSSDVDLLCFSCKFVERSDFENDFT